MNRLSTFLLDKFNDWFVSDNGVWQTLLVCLAVVVTEQVFPHMDPDHFIVLYVLTVYSGVTQPALARAGRVSSEQQEKMILQIESLEKKMVALLETTGSNSDSTMEK